MVSSLTISLAVTAWCRCVQNRRDKKFRLAVGSFIEEYENQVEIITCMTIAHLCASAGSISGHRADLELLVSLQ